MSRWPARGVGRDTPSPAFIRLPGGGTEEYGPWRAAMHAYGFTVTCCVTMEYRSDRSPAHFAAAPDFWYTPGCMLLRSKHYAVERCTQRARVAISHRRGGCGITGRAYWPPLRAATVRAPGASFVAAVTFIAGQHVRCQRRPRSPRPLIVRVLPCACDRITAARQH